MKPTVKVIVNFSGMCERCMTREERAKVRKISKELENHINTQAQAALKAIRGSHETITKKRDSGASAKD